MGLLVASIGACYMPMRENISVKLVGPREFPRYVLINHEDKFYRGPHEGYGMFHEALWYASLKRATTQSLLLRDLAKLDRERRESERRRMSGEEENTDDE